MDIHCAQRIILHILLTCWRRTSVRSQFPVDMNTLTVIMLKSNEQISMKITFIVHDPHRINPKPLTSYSFFHQAMFFTSTYAFHFENSVSFPLVPPSAKNVNFAQRDLTIWAAICFKMCRYLFHDKAGLITRQSGEISWHLKLHEPTQLHNSTVCQLASSSLIENLFGPLSPLVGS